MFFINPKTIETRSSKINKEVKITKLLGTYRLVVGDCTQSGGLIVSIWEKALMGVENKVKSKKPKILILGLGAGSVAKISKKIWPKSSIIGVEIDPVIIKLAKKYFALNKINNLKILNKNAISWAKIQAANHRSRFDLILVDIYIGSQLPREVMEKKFLESIYQLLKPGGIALFNRLVLKSKKQEVEKFKNLLLKHYLSLDTIPTPANRVFAVTKQ